MFILQNFCTLKKYKRAAIMVGSFHPTLYVNQRRTKKLYKLYTKPYILFVILLIISALRSVWFVLQTLHKLYTKPYTATTKPYTATLHSVLEHESREGSKCVVCCDGVSKCTFWLHPRRCVRMAKMQGAEDEGAGSVLKYMTKPESDSNEADWLL